MNFSGEKGKEKISINSEKFVGVTRKLGFVYLFVENFIEQTFVKGGVSVRDVELRRFFYSSEEYRYH